MEESEIIYRDIPNDSELYDVPDSMANTNVAPSRNEVQPPNKSKKDSSPDEHTLRGYLSHLASESK